MTEPADRAHTDPIGFDPDHDVILDPRHLRGLAHPLRVRLRHELVSLGPATATQLASRIGESSGSTSYHLRQLAAYGFIVEDEALGTGKERYWRAVHRRTWFGGVMPDKEPERTVSAEYVRSVARTYADRVLRFADDLEAATEVLVEEWDRAWDMSDWLLDLTPDQARELAARFRELCLPHRRHPDTTPPPGTRGVVAQFQVLPLPATC